MQTVAGGRTLIGMGDLYSWREGEGGEEELTKQTRGEAMSEMGGALRAKEELPVLRFSAGILDLI